MYSEACRTLAGAAIAVSKDAIMLIYKVIEIGTVTEDAIEEVLNDWSIRGWNFDGLQFAMRESSKRPSMAFALFTREETNDEVES
jgi:hypothetical protein